jgi:hypothetical protein
MVTFSTSDVGIFVQRIQADNEKYFSCKGGSTVVLPPKALYYPYNFPL